VDLIRKSSVVYLTSEISSNRACFECFDEFCRQVPSAFIARTVHGTRTKSWSIAGLHPQSPHHLHMTTFSVSLTNLTAPLPQSRDYSCYVSRRILASPPLWLQKHTDLRAHDFAHYPDLWQPRFANVICVRNLETYGINPAISVPCYSYNFNQITLIKCVMDNKLNARNMNNIRVCIPYCAGTITTSHPSVNRPVHTRICNV
jgi:hypothetical protein